MEAYADQVGSTTEEPQEGPQFRRTSSSLIFALEYCRRKEIDPITMAPVVTLIRTVTTRSFQSMPLPVPGLPQWSSKPNWIRSAVSTSGHGSRNMVEQVYSHLGQVHQRSEVVEFRIEQHRERLGNRLVLVESGGVGE